MTGGINIGVDMDVIVAGVKRLQRAIESAGNSDLSQMGQNVTQYEVGGVRGGNVQALQQLLERMKADLINRSKDATTLTANVSGDVSKLQMAVADLQRVDANAAADAQRLVGEIAEATGVPVSGTTSGNTPPAPTSGASAGGREEQADTTTNEYAV